MTKKIRIADIPEFDPAEHLKDEEDIAVYLTLVIEDGDVFELARALDIAARARGISTQEWNQTLHSGTIPSFETVNHACQSLGIKLVAQPLAQHSSAT